MARSDGGSRGDAAQEAALVYHDLARAVTQLDGPAAGRPLLDSSIARLRAIPGLPPQELARALQHRAEASWDVAEQRRLLDEVVALRRRPGTDSVDVAASLNAEGGEAASRGDYGRAAALFDASLRILERTMPPGHPHRLAVAGNLASSLMGRGDYVRAEQLEREIIPLLPAATPGDVRAIHEERLALLALYQGRLPEAERRMRAALAQLREAVGPAHDRLANTTRNLGSVLIARGDVAGGAALIDSAAHLLRPQGDAAMRYVAYMMGQRGIALLRLGRTAEAREAVRAARAPIEAAFPAGHHYHGDLALWLGVVALADGDARGAAAELERSLRLRQALFPPDHPKVLEAACALGAARAAHSADLRRTCTRYARWGLADPVVVEQGLRD